MSKTAVVIGGSLGGLMHGIMLKRHGYAVTILEQDPSAAREGFDAGIMVKDDLRAFLKIFNRIERPLCVAAEGPQFNLNNDGRSKFSYRKEAFLTSWGLLVSIMRGNFDGQPSEAVPEIQLPDRQSSNVAFRHGARVTNVEESGNKVRVQFEDVLASATKTVMADLVIAADGSRSTIRKILLPHISPRYAGYLAWRGVVREDLIEERHRKALQNSVTFHSAGSGYIILYVIPTDNGEMSVGKRLLNWVWYTPFVEDSKELREAMTDVHGKRHVGTVPRGLVRPEIWERQQTLGIAIFPSCLSAVIAQSHNPFVTKIQDVVSDKGVFLGDKLFLVGDALIGLRPNIGASTGQAAYHCLQLEKVIEKKITASKWEKAVLRYGYAKHKFSIAFASYWVGTRLGFTWALFKYFLLLIRQRLGLTS